jgi:hypothetical protein
MHYIGVVMVQEICNFQEDKVTKKAFKKTTFLFKVVY